ncbi:MAG: energy transducer TonB [Sedimentitalea sp.]|nr:energy transducer TonB [Sedimentitalea sp.]
MQTGTKISAAAHVGLIGLALLSGRFSSEPLPFEVNEVSLISAEEYAALTAPRQPPRTVDAPEALTQPETPAEEPGATPTPETPPDQAAPEPAPQPVPDPEPEVAPQPPAPETEATDTAPVLEPPAAEITPEPPAIRPQPRRSDRVAPTPVAPPPPEATPDEEVRPEVTEEAGAETPQEAQQATAPEAATDRIVTEAETDKPLAPESSRRPPANRPKAPAPPTQTAQPRNTEGAVDDAVLEALGLPDTAKVEEAPEGPPLSAGEADALRVAVQQCWNVGSLSSDALATTVVVAVSLTPDGKPVGNSIRLLSSSGGGEQAARQAFEAGRRAILRCGATGFKLPAEKYEQWRDIEITFNPERMRIK